MRYGRGIIGDRLNDRRRSRDRPNDRHKDRITVSGRYGDRRDERQSEVSQKKKGRQPKSQK